MTATEYAFDDIKILLQYAVLYLCWGSAEPVATALVLRNNALSLYVRRSPILHTIFLC